MAKGGGGGGRGGRAGGGGAGGAIGNLRAEAASLINLTTGGALLLAGGEGVI